MSEKRCKHENTWFDRTVCEEPCGAMHTVCSDCSAVVDYCCHNEGLGDWG
jgi:hypothetical protein